MGRILALLFFCGGTLPAAVPTLTNGDFFQRNDRNEPTGWQIRYTDPAMKGSGLVVASGSGVLTLGGTGLRGEVLVFQPNIRLEGGKKYRFSFEARTAGEDANLRVYIQYQNLKEGKAEPITVNGDWKKLSAGWQTFSFELNYPVTGRSPWLVINSSGRNSAELKNLTVTEE